MVGAIRQCPAVPVVQLQTTGILAKSLCSKLKWKKYRKKAHEVGTSARLWPGPGPVASVEWFFFSFFFCQLFDGLWQQLMTVAFVHGRIDTQKMLAVCARRNECRGFNENLNSLSCNISPPIVVFLDMHCWLYIKCTSSQPQSPNDSQNGLEEQMWNDRRNQSEAETNAFVR